MNESSAFYATCLSCPIEAFDYVVIIIIIHPPYPFIDIPSVDGFLEMVPGR